MQDDSRRIRFLLLLLLITVIGRRWRRRWIIVLLFQNLSDGNRKGNGGLYEPAGDERAFIFPCKGYKGYWTSRLRIKLLFKLFASFA